MYRDTCSATRISFFSTDYPRADSKCPHADGTTVPQAIVISGLKSVWLPAAAVPVRIEGRDAVGWDRVSESLVAATVTKPAFSYRVEVPARRRGVPPAAALRGVAGEYPVGRLGAAVRRGGA